MPEGHKTLQWSVLRRRRPRQWQGMGPPRGRSLGPPPTRQAPVARLAQRHPAAGIEPSLSPAAPRHHPARWAHRGGAHRSPDTHLAGHHHGRAHRARRASAHRRVLRLRKVRPKGGPRSQRVPREATKPPSPTVRPHQHRQRGHALWCGFIRAFRGPASKNLAAYAAWFTLLRNPGPTPMEIFRVGARGSATPNTP